MSYKNYKKSKLGKLKSFCAVVENEDSILKASEAIMISSSSISKDISSLEKDLGYKLFDRVKNKLLLNKNGQEYYKIAKNIILDLKKAYSPGLENIDKSEIKRVLKRKKIEIIKKKLDNWKMNINKILNKMLVKITWKKVISFFAICILGFFIWAERTNFWFDREMKKLANPLLKEVMENGIYRIPEDSVCSYDSTEITYQFSTLSFQLTDNDSSIPQTRIQINDCPGTALRINEKKEIAMAFYNSKEIKCDLNRRFDVILRSYAVLKENFDKKKNFRYYSFYKKNNCTNQSIFEQNMKKYPDQIFGTYVGDRKLETGNGAINMFKKGRYYYLLILVNGSQPHYRDVKKEKYFLYRKLTLEELKTVYNGSYWNLIKEYNIKID